MTRVRLRAAYPPEALSGIYPAPHDHAGWPDHVHRVRETITAGRELISRLLLPEEITVADLSCGDSVITDEIARCAGRQNRHSTVTVIRGDYAPGHAIRGMIEDTVSTVTSADIFICCETIEHLDDPDDVLAKIRQRAGALLLSTPLAEWHDGNPEHYWGWDHDGVREMLAGAGWHGVIQRDAASGYIPPGQVLGAVPFQIWGCT